MVAVIGRQVDDPYVILCSTACLCVCNDEDNSEHAQKIHTKVEGRDGGGILTKPIYFYEKYDGLVLYFITNSYLLLASFYVGFLYILVQNLIFSILTHNPKKYVENM